MTQALTAPDITLSATSETTTLGSAISGYTISNAGGAVVSYTLSPSVSNGLSFNTSSGLISGTPGSVAAAVVYTITATNTAGSDSATFSITVIDAPVSTPRASHNTSNAEQHSHSFSRRGARSRCGCHTIAS
jgi:hypothetical protein